MSLEIFLLTVGLGLLFLHEYLSNLRKLHILVGNYSSLTPKVVYENESYQLFEEDYFFKRKGGIFFIHKFNLSDKKIIEKLRFYQELVFIEWALSLDIFDLNFEEKLRFVESLHADGVRVQYIEFVISEPNFSEKNYRFEEILQKLSLLINQLKSNFPYLKMTSFYPYLERQSNQNYASEWFKNEIFSLTEEHRLSFDIVPVINSISDSILNSFRGLSALEESLNLSNEYWIDPKLLLSDKPVRWVEIIHLLFFMAWSAKTRQIRKIILQNASQNIQNPVLDLLMELFTGVLQSGQNIQLSWFKIL